MNRALGDIPFADLAATVCEQARTEFRRAERWERRLPGLNIDALRRRAGRLEAMGLLLMALALDEAEVRAIAQRRTDALARAARALTPWAR